jgi:hypothetical protein
VGSSPEYTPKPGHIADQPLRTLDVAGGFLDADDAGDLGQAQHGVVLHVGHRAAGHVVEHHGQVAHGFGDGLEVLVLAFLRGLVVVGHDLQLAVGAHLLGVLGQLDGFVRAVGAAAGHDGTRPAACSTDTRMISQCSSTFTVGDSPVVPTTPMQLVPSATCQSMSLRSDG